MSRLANILANIIVSALLICLLPFIALGVVAFGLVAIWGKGKKGEAVETEKAQEPGHLIPTNDTSRVNIFGVN